MRGRGILCSERAAEKMNLCLESVGSPIGDLLVAASGEAVCAIAFEGGEADTERYLARRHGAFAKARGRVPAWFAVMPIWTAVATENGPSTNSPRREQGRCSRN
jgi:hypothetical protein